MSLHGKKIRLWAYDRAGNEISIYLSNEASKVLHITVVGSSLSEQKDYYVSFDNFVKALYELRHSQTAVPARHAKKEKADGEA